MTDAKVCKNYVRVAYAQTGAKEALFTRLRCGSWSCEACAEKNASIWRAHLVAKLPKISKEWWLLTLTAPSDKRTTEQSLASLRKGIDTLIKRAKRVFGALSYVRIYERHPTSRAIHAHLVISGLSPFVVIGYSAKLRPMAIAVIRRNERSGTWSIKTWFKKTAQECHMGYIVDVRVIAGEPSRAVGYVMKYATKAQQDLHIKGLRHIQTTRDIGGPKTEKALEWQTAAYITAKMFPPNTAVTDLNTGSVIDNDYWEVKGFYPYDD